MLKIGMKMRRKEKEGCMVHEDNISLFLYTYMTGMMMGVESGKVAITPEGGRVHAT